jgi:dihydrofolate reductase/thymidylate synthase
MELNIIVAGCKNFGIGKDGGIPWNIHEDMRRFRKKTQGHIIIMGRKTWESLPQRPLPHRLNIVVSSSPQFRSSDDSVLFTPIETLPSVLEAMWKNYSKAFVIGGTELYRWALPRADKIYMTHIEKEYDCDTFFPLDYFAAYKQTFASARHFSDDENAHYRFLEFTNKLTIPYTQPDTLVPCDMQYLHDEYEYLRLISDILKNGESRPDRTGVGTLALFAKQIRFDISDNILPLITTKFVGWRGVLKELLWFLRGSTDSKELEAQNVNIWRDNSTRSFLDSRGLTQYRDGDIGPMYFYNVFHYGAEYKGCDKDYTSTGHDQMAELMNSLKTDPYSRRHMLTTYNPATVKDSVLAPCHGIVIQFFVSGPIDDKQLSCHMYQRSMDTGLGACWNFASYAMLTHIIAAKVGMRAKELIISTGDTHIYSNHIVPLKEQLERTPFPFPRFEFDTHTIAQKDWNELTPDDFDVTGYFSHAAIKLPMAV